MNLSKIIKITSIVFVISSLISCSKVPDTYSTSSEINTDSQTIVDIMQAYDQSADQEGIENTSTTK